MYDNTKQIVVAARNIDIGTEVRFSALFVCYVSQHGCMHPS